MDQEKREKHLEQAAERQRAYRERQKANPELAAAYRKKRQEHKKRYSENLKAAGIKPEISERSRVNRAAYNAAYREANKEKIAEAAKAWYAENRETVLARRREQHRADPEKAKARNAEYRAQNAEAIKRKRKLEYALDPEGAAARLEAWAAANPGRKEAVRKKNYEANPKKFIEAARAWQKANPEKFSAVNARRRAAESRAIPGWADFVSIMAIYEECQYVTNLTGEEHHVDHIVPLRSSVVCGLHWELNLQILPAKENISKGNRTWPDMP